MKWFLIWLVTQSTSGGVVIRTIPQSSYEQCMKTLEATRVSIPNGGDAETTITVTCGPSVVAP